MADLTLGAPDDPWKGLDEKGRPKPWPQRVAEIQIDARSRVIMSNPFDRRFYDQRMMARIVGLPVEV